MTRTHHGTWKTVRAAAGTGKTVALARQYLKLLQQDLDVDRIVAITFTRKAAAELIERVSLVLYAMLADGSPQSVQARERLGDDIGIYREGIALDERRIRRALADLSTAPVGTIDSFVQKLLAELALDACYPVEGETVPLDFPLPSQGNPGLVLEEEARGIIAEAQGGAGDEVAWLVRTLGLGAVVEAVTTRHGGGDVPPATIEQVYGALARQLVEHMEERVGAGRARAALIEAVGLRPDPSRWEVLLYDRVKKDGRSGIPALVAWLRSDDDGAVPASFAEVWKYLGEPYGGRLAGLTTVDDPVGDLCARLRALTGEPSAASWLVKAADLAPGGDWAKELARLVSGKGKPLATDVADWLKTGDDVAAPACTLDFLGKLSLGKKILPKTGPIAETFKAATRSAEVLVDRLKAHTGGRTVASWLCEQLDLDVPLERWPGFLKGSASTGNGVLAAQVADWLSASEDGDPPGALVPFVARLQAGPSADVASLCFGYGEDDGRIEAVGLELEVGSSHISLPLSRFKSTSLDPDYFQTRYREQADRLRRALDGLRARVTRQGMARAAREGALSYGDLLETAVHLCHEAAAGRPPGRLRGRFEALLVDEVQDSSPRQVDFYRALATTNPDMQCFFVGDSRQSIYMFRGAAPSGIDDLAHEGEGTPLDTNYRSVPDLVAAQRELFGGRLLAALSGSHVGGFAELGGLGAGKTGAYDAPPVTLIIPQPDDETTAQSAPPAATPMMANERALERFAEEMDARWEAGEDCTAAVLAPQWSVAIEATDVLRSRLGRDRAFLDGGGRWMEGRVVQDIRILLAALLDRSDQMAWLAVWKHPMVGLSDRALALVRNGDGVLYRTEDGEAAEAHGWMHSLGWMLQADGLTGKHRAADVAAFERARGPLQIAAEQLGRSPTAEVLEGLARDLRWRELLAVDPRADSLAHLELALEWIRELDGAGVNADDVLAVLNAPPDERPEAPRMELHRPRRHVSCTTIFQAKGLEWDHVCLLSPGVGPGGGQGVDIDAAVDVTVSEEPLRLLGVNVDPRGAFLNKTDPVGNLMGFIDGCRRKEEHVRLAYVGITRATKTVMMALPSKNHGGVQKELVAAWAAPEWQPDEVDDEAAGDDAAETTGRWVWPQLEGVTLEAWEPASETSVAPSRWVRPVDGGALADLTLERSTWRKQAPSGVGDALGGDRKKELAAQTAKQILARGTDVDALYDLVATPSQFHDLRADQWGNLAHGWFAEWRFEGAPDAGAVRGYLDREWGGSHDAVAAWLVELSSRMAGHPSSPMWQLVTRPGVQLHFEYPIVGVARLGAKSDEPFLVSGSLDLLVRDPSRDPSERWTVIDFKAGSKTVRRSSPDPEKEAWEQLVGDAGLKTYAPQLEAYREALQRALDRSGRFAGEGVAEVGLWFVRTGSSVSW